ncbi:hypothetical protein VQ042_17920 [Aurantimonas sp. A2-1-M11]|uniref:hypothetical protein n=1 Tax=Aurantimonas sp. A2-1-M11 TaxID=3113712 RepID=UPI002F942399
MTLSDRRRVERLLVVDLFRSVVKDGARDLAEPETAETLHQLDTVCIDLLEIEDLDRGLIIRRLQRARSPFDRFRRPGRPVAEFGLTAYHFAKILTDRDVLVIDEASDLSAALDRLLPALAEAEVTLGAEATAETDAWQALRQLQRDGYFSEVSP